MVFAVTGPNYGQENRHETHAVSLRQSVMVDHSPNASVVIRRSAGRASAFGAPGSGRGQPRLGQRSAMHPERLAGLVGDLDCVLLPVERYLPAARKDELGLGVAEVDPKDKRNVELVLVKRGENDLLLAFCVEALFM